MKTVTILELWKKAKKSNEPLLASVSSLSEFPFMEVYKDNFSKLDRDFAKTRGVFSPLWNTQYEDDADGVLEEFREDVASLLFKNCKSYQHLWDLTMLDYNPIENYSMVEEGTDKRRGDDTISMQRGEKKSVDDIAGVNESITHGKQEVTTEHGEGKITNDYGAVAVTNSVGARSTESVYGEGSTKESHDMQEKTVENGISGFNSSSYEKDTRSIESSDPFDITTTTEKRTDTVNTSAATDISSTGEHSDVQTTAKKSDVESAAEYVDTTKSEDRQNVHVEHEYADEDKTAYNSDTEHYLTRKGNIGVTTTQQMAESEIALWAKLKFYDILFNDIVRELCAYWED